MKHFTPQIPQPSVPQKEHTNAAKISYFQPTICPRKPRTAPAAVATGLEPPQRVVEIWISFKGMSRIRAPW